MTKDSPLRIPLSYIIWSEREKQEISRGSSPLPDTTPFEDQFFWTGYLDLTDGGATMLLPSYTIDVWVTGSDESGNPYDSQGNTISEPLASWPLA